MTILRINSCGVCVCSKKIGEEGGGVITYGPVYSAPRIYVSLRNVIPSRSDKINSRRRRLRAREREREDAARRLPLVRRSCVRIVCYGTRKSLSLSLSGYIVYTRKSRDGGSDGDESPFSGGKTVESNIYLNISLSLYTYT